MIQHSNHHSFWEDDFSANVAFRLLTANRDLDKIEMTIQQTFL